VGRPVAGLVRNAGVVTGVAARKNLSQRHPRGTARRGGPAPRLCCRFSSA